MSKFQVYTDSKGEYRFRLLAGNGENILKSEGYTTKAACENGMASVRTNAADDARYEKKESDAGHSFNLKAANGQVIGTSQVYASAQGRDNGITSVMKNASEATVEEA